jgi:tetratricopeptide (TPR) repeat protein
LLRSFALFAVLYQFRLVAGVLADTAVFAAAVCGGFAAAGLLSVFRFNGKKAGPLAALAATALVPWAVRAFIALPRLFFPGRADSTAVVFDSLLLNFDRNNFVSLLPFYWTAATTWFSNRSRVFLRGAVIADVVLLLVLFSIARTVDAALYRWPIVMIVLFAGIVFTQALALLFSLPPEIRLRKAETISAITVMLALVVIGGFLFLKPSQERAVEKGGGLLEPKLFSFDFSQFLRLDSEISMNDDLILIVKKDNDDDHILLRRSVLSGYSKKQGFYRIEELDERTHPQRLPECPVQFNPAAFGAAKRVKQEYFLVNFDAAAFTGMKEPVLVTPYENWDASSFKSAYAVESVTSTARAAELSRAAPSWPDTADLGLSGDEFRIYTGYGNDERIRLFAEAITAGLDRYGDKVRKIHNTLKYGEYRYSLKPGIAPDGDQLAWFLFQSKKGYCSYYAFAMALMLRSLGIPARVAAGFFIDPLANTFDYYPVRSDMAHAWVEVPFPGYGWIEFDPTTDNLAEGEEFRFSAGVDPDLFERLMREILENRSRLKVKQGQDDPASVSEKGMFRRAAARLLQKMGPLLLPLLMGLVFIYIRCGYFFEYLLCRSKRKRAIRLWNHCRRRLALAGCGRIPGLAESEWAQHYNQFIDGSYALYQNAAAARFAPEFTNDDMILLWNNYLVFRAAYRRHVSVWRRLLTWLLPPLALVSGRKHKLRHAATVVLLLALFSGSNVKAQNADKPALPAGDLYGMAREAEYAKMWERAIELFKEGGAAYPNDFRFPSSLGNLYYSRSLYGLAWDEYRKAEAIDPFDTSILLRLAHTAGCLNRDNVSVEYLERLLSIDSGNKEAISSLGWMYYKVHRLEEGERLLTAALERFNNDPDLAMTLGTVYADMYRYEEGKYWYQKAIAQGVALQDPVFTAVAHYNLSLLESRFYHFALSMDQANASLESQNRSSGRLARGEMYMRRLDLKNAQADYEAAYETDTSPLAKINLAQIYQISGRLEEARRYAEDCLKAGDLSWMMNYGIDTDRYRRDIHEILYKTYAGLAAEERFMPWGRIGEKIRSPLRLVSFRFKSAVHRRLYRKYSLAAGDAYDAQMADSGSPHLDSFIQRYNAFEDYPDRAAAYFRKARDFETAIIPASGPSYNLEEGILRKNTAQVSTALVRLDPAWERELVSQCYRELARRERGAARRAAAEELFTLNRGALRQAGTGLPVEISFNFGDQAAGADDASPANRSAHFTKAARTLRRALDEAGFWQAKTAVRFRLSITVTGSAASGYTAYCELAGTAGGGISLRHALPLRSFSRADIYDFARAFGNVVFKVD